MTGPTRVASARPRRSRTIGGRRWWSPRTLDIASIAIGAVSLALLALPVRPIAPLASTDAAARHERAIAPASAAAPPRDRASMSAGDSALAVLDAARSLLGTVGPDRAFSRSTVLGDSIVRVVVRGNVMSARRRAPASRFTPPGLSGSPESPAPGNDAGNTGSTTSNSTVPDGATGDDAPRLVGIVTIDGTRRALIAADPTAPAQLFAAGERRGTVRVLAIDADRVRVSIGGRSLTLRLARPQPGDSTSLPE